MNKFISFIKDAIESNKQYNAERKQFLKTIQERESEKRLQQILERHKGTNHDR